MHPVRFGVSCDFRNPPDSGVSVMVQVRWLDQLGADLVAFTEHKCTGK